jgi:A/G-specific adenine glycosylase
MPKISAGTDCTVSPSSFPELSHRLLAWFYRNKRELPWREEHDPYRIWISEVMLQQTRSETVAKYYSRWLALFPTLESLTWAEQEDVLKAWEGLGYYSRARNLHRSARIILEKWDGRFPDTEHQIRQLPGIGEYTAAAVLSIAFAKPIGVVDGNVMRVVSRLLAERSPADRGQAERSRESLKRRVRSFVKASFLEYHPGWINQAWMELGALVCLPKPRCSLCPLSYACRAYREGRTAEFPPKESPRPLPAREESLLVLLPTPLPEKITEGFSAIKGPAPKPEVFGELLLQHEVPLLLTRRADRGLLGGLWELPNFPERGDGLSKLLAPLSIRIILDTDQEIRQSYSHFEIRFRSYLALFLNQQLLDPWVEQRWVLPAELNRYPRPKVHIKALRLFGLSKN